MQRLSIANWRQPHEGDCLPASAAMILRSLGHQVDYGRLRRQLGTTSIGTPFSNLKRLQAGRLRVEVGTGTVDTIRQQLTAGHPIIVVVATELLPYWMVRPDVTEANRATEHAVVIIGLADQTVYVNDPDFDDAPQSVELGWFTAAWQHQNFLYAVIQH